MVKVPIHAQQRGAAWTSLQGPCVRQQRARSRSGEPHLVWKAAASDASDPSLANGDIPRDVSKDVQKAIRDLKAKGMDMDVAREMMECWRQENIQDKKKYSRAIWKDGAVMLLLSLLQLGVDILASRGAAIASVAAATSNFVLHNVVSTIFLALSYYFLLTIALDVFRIGAVVVTTVLMGTSAKKMYAAVETMAGEKTGVPMIDKVSAAVSTAKVVQSLRDVRDAIKGGNAPYDGKAPWEGDDPFATDDLSAYFVLRHAEDTYGAESIHQFGLSDKEIQRAAAAFGSADKNNSYSLEYSEFMTLCAQLGVKLTQSEVNAAMSILDTRGSGKIEFDEFLAWWSGNAGAKLNEPEPKSAGA